MSSASSTFFLTGEPGLLAVDGPTAAPRPLGVRRRERLTPVDFFVAARRVNLGGEVLVARLYVLAVAEYRVAVFEPLVLAWPVVW